MNERQAELLTGSVGIGTGKHFFRFWMPYVFQRINHAGAKHAFLPLNRNYKPLGQLDKKHADYDALAESHGVSFARDPLTFTGIWTNSRPDDGLFWLYDDRPASRTDYFERLEKLMTKSMPVIGSRRRNQW